MTEQKLKTADSRRQHWLMGSARAMAEIPHLFPAELAWQHGGIARFRVLHRPFAAIAHPEYARQVLVTRHNAYQRSYHYRTGSAVIGEGLLSTDGEHWLKHRRQVLPAFGKKTMERVVEASRAAAADALVRWNAMQKTGSPLPIVQETQRLALSTIARTLLSVEMEDSEAERFGKAVRETLYLVRRRNTSWLPHWAPSPADRKMYRTRAILDDYLQPHIRRRQHSAQTSAPDMLHALLQAQDPNTAEPLDNQALLDETKTLFVSGFETTATALAWALHLLARDIEAQQKWQEECRTVLNGRLPEMEDLEKMPFTRQIINETLRLYPPVYNMARECIESDEIGGKHIYPRDVLIISIYGIHRSEEYWKSPGCFVPERFAPGSVYDPHAFLPFAVGKHVCIGAQFAMYELMTFLAVLGSSVRLTPSDNQPIGIRAQITLAPEREICLHLEELA